LRLAESNSSICGLVPHLRLLPTPPLGDAVTFSFQAGERMPGEDSHLYTCALAGALAQGIALGSSHHLIACCGLKGRAIVW
jgi:hypothetical protein